MEGSMREELQWFAGKMQAQLDDHKGTHGDTWKTMNLDDLMLKAVEELGEVIAMYRHGTDYGEWIITELADAGNILMMIANRMRMLAGEEPELTGYGGQEYRP